MFVPSPNQLANEQIGKDKFVLNTRKTSNKELAYFQFLGILMGICIRTGVLFPINLPRSVWKKLVGQNINMDDLIEVEFRFVKLVKDLLNWDEEQYNLNAEMGIVCYYWTTELSDGTVVDLTDSGVGGKDQLVKYEERREYVKRALHARLVQSDNQCNAIKYGISQVIPAALLNIGTFDELEEWVSGKNYVDIEMLRRHTVTANMDYIYDGCDVMNFFWQMLEESSQTEL